MTRGLVVYPACLVSLVLNHPVCVRVAVRYFVVVAPVMCTLPFLQLVPLLPLSLPRFSSLCLCHCVDSLLDSVLGLRLIASPRIDYCSLSLSIYISIYLYMYVSTYITHIVHDNICYYIC